MNKRRSVLHSAGCAHGPVKGLFFGGQDVTAAGVSGAMVSGLVAASAVLERDLFREL